MTNFKIAIIGASGAIGSALVTSLATESSNTIYAFSRSKTKFTEKNISSHTIEYNDESSISAAAEIAGVGEELDLVVVTNGILHDEQLSPEKSLRDLSRKNLEKYFFTNTIEPMLVAKYFLKKLHNDKRAVFAALSARVGSISDNRLGGWYGYRASKAALNMMLKNASIEITRTKKQAIVVGLHPGTVDSKLSLPFQRNVPEKQLFDASYSATKLINVLKKLDVCDNGKVFAWDGKEINA